MNNSLFACPTGSLGISRGLSVSLLTATLPFATPPDAEFNGVADFSDVCVGGTALPDVCGGETGLTRVRGGWTCEAGCEDEADADGLTAANWLRMRSALLGGLSASESYVILRRLAAGSTTFPEVGDGGEGAVRVDASGCCEASDDATSGASCE